MITVSLNEIEACYPCVDGWKKVLKSKGGTKADMDASFPLIDILESNDFDDTLWCFRCLPAHKNLWRKYAVWCARQAEHLLTDERSRDALDVAWRHSDGLATDKELKAARSAASDASSDAASDAASAAASGDAAMAAASAARAARAASAAAYGAQKEKLIEILAAEQWVE